MFSLMIGYWLTRNLSILTEASKEVASGNLTPPHVPEGNDDVGRLGAAFNTMSRMMAKRVQDLLVSSEPLESANAQLLTEITERKHAEERHKQLEAQLLQAQKMEAVGLLAGGVAHDFNNLLMVILGSASLMDMKIEKSSPLSTFLHQISAAAEKAADLTKQLLAFSTKQTIDPKPTDLNNLVKGIEKLLRRILSENIELKIALSNRALSVMVDPGQ